MIKIFSILIHFNPTYKITGTWIMSFGTCILFFQKKKRQHVFCFIMLDLDSSTYIFLFFWFFSFQKYTISWPKYEVPNSIQLFCKKNKLNST